MLCTRYVLGVILVLILFQAVQAANLECGYDTGKTRAILDIELAPNGEDIVAADGVMYILNCKKKDINSGWAATTIDISDDGSFIATASDINICLFTIEGDKKWCDESFQGGARDVSIAEDNSRIVVGSDARASIYMFSKTGEILWKRTVGTPIFTVASPASMLYTFTATEQEIGAFGGKGGVVWFEYPKDCEMALEVYDAETSKSGEYILAGCQYANNGKIVQIDTSGKFLWEYPVDGFASTVAISEDGAYLATGTNNVLKRSGSIYFFSFNRTSEQGTLLWSHDVGSKVTSLDMTTDGSLLAAGLQDNRILLFDNSGNDIFDYSTDDSVTTLTFSVDGRYLATGSAAGEILYFSTGMIPSEPEFPPEAVSAVNDTPSPTPTSSAQTAPSVASNNSQDVLPTPTGDSGEAPLTSSEEQIPSAATKSGEMSMVSGILPFGLLGGAIFMIVVLQRRKE